MVPSRCLGHPLCRGDRRGSARAAPPCFAAERDPVGTGLAAQPNWGMCHESLSQLKSVKGLKSHDSLGSSQWRAALSFSRGQAKTEEEQRGKGPFAGKSLCSQLSPHPSSIRALSGAGSDGGELRWGSASLARTRSSRSQDVARNLLL